MATGKRVAILQSAYIPWKGYFDIIGMVDEFVVYDDVQYSKNHWHNRNLIKTQHGLKWLTVPVSKAEGAHQTIDSVRLPRPFADKHWTSVREAYARAPHFAHFAPMVEALYKEARGIGSLSELNLLFLRAIATALGLGTTFTISSGLRVAGERTERLVGICRALGASTYLSGPSAQSYLDVGAFAAAGIAVEWMDYGGYPEYPQLHGAFEHTVSIIDLMFTTGPDARRYMKTPVH